MELTMKLDLFILPEDQCRTCLSIGRKLVPLQEYSLQIYFKLMTDYHKVTFPKTSIQVCWECHKLFRNISYFQDQIQKAEQLIKLGQNIINGTLSRLSCITLNDVHVQNITHEYGDVHIPEEVKVEIDDDVKYFNINQLLDDDLGDNYEMELKDENTLTVDKVEKLPFVPVKLKSIKKIKLKHTNKWAAERAKESKNKQFRIILPKNLKLGNLFKHLIVTPKEVSEHLNKDRDSENYKLQMYKCENCAVTFKMEAYLVKHRQLKHNESNKYTCDMCKQKLSDKDKLTKHIKQHCTKYSCNTCAFTSSDRKVVIKHYKKMFECIKCQLKFCSKRFFLEHHKQWHEQYICDKCGVQFKMKYCIEKHIRTQHGPFKCSKCPKQFSRYKSIWQHYKIHHGPPSEPVYCVECDTHYTDQYRYKCHLANSVKHKTRRKRSFPCWGCDKEFTKRIYLTNHVNYVHLKKFIFRCEQCDKNFLRNEDLRKHSRKVHEGIQPPKNKICYICGRGFTTNRILTNHIHTHTGERPHACSLCPAAFAQKAALHSHMRALHSSKQDHNNGMITK